jgi:hypothetical protein
VGSEYFINSQELENKVRQLLPSQGGAGAGFDLSASTQIIPIIDLTESAQGSNLRQDLQSSFSHNTTTSFSVSNTTSTLITNTGYFKVYGNATFITNGSADRDIDFSISDGSTSKRIWSQRAIAGVSNQFVSNNFEFICFLSAGDSLTNSASADSFSRGGFRQIASIDGTLTNP